MSTQHNDEVIQKVCDEFYQQKIDGIYRAHQPIYGYRTPYAETSQIARLILTKNILDTLAKYKFKDFTDISAAEGYTSFLVKNIFGAKVRCTDWSQSVCTMANKLFGLDSQVADIKALPFADNSCEVVLCSETLEHVTDWRKGFDELLRITKDLLVITVPHDTIEYVEWSRENEISGHINHFTAEAFDFIKDLGYNFRVVKSLCRLTLKPRVIVEGYKKEGAKYALYNKFTPLFKKIFGQRSAEWMIDNDAKFVKATGSYGNILVVIEKGNVQHNEAYKPIRAKDFINYKIPLYYLDK